MRGVEPDTATTVDLGCGFGDWRGCRSTTGATTRVVGAGASIARFDRSCRHITGVTPCPLLSPQRAHGSVLPLRQILMTTVRRLPRRGPAECNQAGCAPLFRKLE